MMTTRIIPVDCLEIKYPASEMTSLNNALANLFPNCLLRLWCRTCSSSAVRFFLRIFLSSLLLAISPARARKPWRGSMHGKHRHASVRTLDCDSQQWI